VAALDHAAARNFDEYGIAHCRTLHCLHDELSPCESEHQVTSPAICATFGAFTRAAQRVWSAMKDTWPQLERIPFPALARRQVTTLQVNVGYRCNQSCVHCHVGAGPHRTEQMGAEVIDLVLAVLKRRQIATLDITGGAPELNPHFRDLVRAARAIGTHVIDRCNLTILEVAGREDLAEFLAGQEVEITASMPCYLEHNVDQQRGKGVFEASIRALKSLNTLGYGVSGSKLTLNLVYNPQGPSLPPGQAELEADYKRMLGDEHGIAFNRLYTLANMPIQRFGAILLSKDEFDRYLALLRGAHRDENLAGVMCRDLISVDWRGQLYDCDFNQMLDLPAIGADRRRLHISDLLADDLAGNAIQVAGHCYGCTAGQGSSCGGALREPVE
jgi:radical SAM/Cys-rich protein